MFKHKFKLGHVGKIILIVWIVFASLYVVISEYNRIQTYVAKASYNSGVTAAVAQLMQQASTCQPFPVTLEGNQVNLINFDCLNAESEEASE